MAGSSQYTYVNIDYKVSDFKLPLACPPSAPPRSPVPTMRRLQAVTPSPSIGAAAPNVSVANATSIFNSSISTFGLTYFFGYSQNVSFREWPPAGCAGPIPRTMLAVLRVCRRLAGLPHSICRCKRAGQLG